MQGISEEIDRLGAHIHAAENWSEDYLKTPEIHAKLLKTEASLQRALRKFFYDLSQNTKLIHWNRYRELQADYRIDVLINNEELDASDGTFIKVVLGDITEATALGAAAGDALYPIKLGLSSSDEVIQRIALDRSAELVGKTVLPDGSIVDNVLGGLDISEITRANIRQSIKTSIALGENVQEAKARLQSVIKNPKRAQLISRTEVVNSFGQGLTEYGKQTGAVGKQWRDTGAQDICAENTSAGPIRFDEQFPSGDYQPTAHPNCRCSIRLIYKNELDANPNLFDGGGSPGANNYDWANSTYEERYKKAGAAYRDNTYKSFDKRNGDRELAAIYDVSGFDAKPRVVSAAEMDKLVADGHIELFRGVSTIAPSDGQKISAEVLRQQFKTGDYHYAGYGMFGNGTYTAARINVAADYTSDNKVMRMTIAKDAKIIYTDEVFSRQTLLERKLEQASKAAKTKAARDKIDQEGHMNMDSGRWAALQGYDAIRYGRKADDLDTMLIILNRGKVIVQDVDVDAPII